MPPHPLETPSTAVSAWGSTIPLCPYVYADNRQQFNLKGTSKNSGLPEFVRFYPAQWDSGMRIRWVNLAFLMRTNGLR